MGSIAVGGGLPPGFSNEEYVVRPVKSIYMQDAMDHAQERRDAAKKLQKTKLAARAKKKTKEDAVLKVNTAL